MLVCSNCASLGVRTASKSKASIPGLSGDHSGKSPLGAPRITSPFYVDTSEESELIEEYNIVIRQARERLGITQDELGNKVNEKPSTIRLVERGSLRPSDSLTRKLEHFLRIDLMAPAVDED